MDKRISKLITKRFINMVEKFNEELKAFAEYSEEKEAYLYEDICMSFTLSNVRIEGEYLVYNYDGEENRDILAYWDEEEDDMCSNIDEAKEQIKFWRACLRRAKKYFSMSPEELDAKEEMYLYGEGYEEEEEEAEEAAAPESGNEEEAAAKAEEAACFEAMKKEAEETAEEYTRMALGNESVFQCNLSEFDRAEIRYKAAYLRRRAAEYKAKAAEYQAKAEAARKESITNKK